MVQMYKKLQLVFDMAKLFSTFVVKNRMSLQ